MLSTSDLGRSECFGGPQGVVCVGGARSASAGGAPAELRVVALVGDSLNNIQIAERLFLTRNTVNGHVAAAFRKLGISNRTELTAEALRGAAR